MMYACSQSVTSMEQNLLNRQYFSSLPWPIAQPPYSPQSPPPLPFTPTPEITSIQTYLSIQHPKRLTPASLTA